jgi:3-isopropylmalate/(R)-2-methylmalate dehydratase large subunit
MAAMKARTLFDKIWDSHVVADLGGDTALLHIDRHIMHDLSGGRGLRRVSEQGYSVRNPELTFASPDHAVSSLPGRTGDTTPLSAQYTRTLREEAKKHGIRLFDLGEDGQGIVHVIGPELGISQPGMTLVCGDSHTCTHGALGAMAWGIGTSELVNVLATQLLQQRRPKRMRITFDGQLSNWVRPKDMILHIIGTLGAAAGTGYAVEFAGPAIRALSMEGRLTLCNLSIEMGARFGMIAPDDTTIEYLADRPFSPKKEHWDGAVSYWRSLATDAEATFDREEAINVSDIAPQVTWGTSPQDVIGIDGIIPDPSSVADATRRKEVTAALQYMGLEPGRPIAGTKVDHVFIGSCANSRIEDLRDAAEVVEGRRVSPSVTAWIVPGSLQVKRQAEAEGLDRLFMDAGFEWREPGCSQCAAANGEYVQPGQRCVSTSNRNFVGRQGPGARTHLASPAMAAAAAVSGVIADVRQLGA